MSRYLYQYYSNNLFRVSIALFVQVTDSAVLGRVVKVGSSSAAEGGGQKYFKHLNLNTITFWKLSVTEQNGEKSVFFLDHDTKY